MDFLIRDEDHIIPLEVKAKNGRIKSLNHVTNNNELIKNGIKLANRNIGKENNIITFPYFLTFLLKRYFSNKDDEK